MTENVEKPLVNWAGNRVGEKILLKDARETVSFDVSFELKYLTADTFKSIFPNPENIL